MKRSQLKRKSPLKSGGASLKQNKPINQRSKTNKMRHVSNVRLPDDTECYFCGSPYDDLHELEGSASRNRSIKHGFQVPVCRRCHNHWDLYMTDGEKRMVRAKEQQRIMQDNLWTVEDWLYLPNGKPRFKKSYI